MKITLEQLAQLLEGVVEGDPKAEVGNISKIDQSEPGTLSFLANPKYESYIYECKSTAVLVSHEFVAQKPISTSLIRVKDPYAAFTFLLEQFAAQMQKKSGIEPHSFISEGSKYGEEVYIGAFAYIGKDVTLGNKVQIYPNTYIGDGVTIGSGTIIYSGVQIYHSSVVGSNCIIHAGTVIGSDGFGHAPQADGSYKKIPQTGNVVIEDWVEIGANCTIDRATIGSTIIRKGVKLDNLIQVAHNVEIGENTVIAAQAGISGSTRIGKQNMIGGQVGFVGHITVADGTQIGAQSGIMKNIEEPNKAWIGSPIYEIRESFKMQAAYRNLPDIYKKMKELERAIQKLQNPPSEE
jgi:UDP-3-O-[3-hydroxymyristoyl] glucosamine N-acyltransferase